MIKITINNTLIEYTVIRSKRKSISITVKPDKQLIVRAPYFVEDNVIEKALNEKANWIINTMKKLSTSVKSDNENYVDGKIIKYLGNDYALSLKITINFTKPVVKLMEDDKLLRVFITKNTTTEEIKNAIDSWYRAQAKIIFNRRVRYYEQFINERHNDIRIKDQKTCWGSCSSKRNLNFNVRLVTKPIEILDYVVVHELCHLKYMNHSKEFWNHVEEILPDYKERMKLLK